MDGVVMLRGIWRHRYLIMTRYPSRYVTAELSEALPRLRTAAKPNPRLPDRPLEITPRTRKQRVGGSGGVHGG